MKEEEDERMHVLDAEMEDEELVQKYRENVEEFDRDLEGILTCKPYDKKLIPVFPDTLTRRQYDVDVLKDVPVKIRNKYEMYVWFTVEISTKLGAVPGRFEVFVISPFIELTAFYTARDLRAWLRRREKRELRPARQAERERKAAEKNARWNAELQKVIEEREMERERRRKAWEEEKDGWF